MPNNLNEPQSRTEEILQNALGEEYDVTPQSRVEILLNQIFEGGGAGGGGFEIHICSASEYDAATKIPTIATPDPKTLYLVPTSEESGNLFDEFIWTGTVWERFGAGSVNVLKNIMDGSAVGSVRTSTSAQETSNYQLGANAFTEGANTKASGNSAHAEGNGSNAYANYSHAEGYSTAGVSGQPTKGIYSHAEGSGTIASGDYSHAEGYGTTASGSNSHTEGYNTRASGYTSHAEGGGAIASGDYSHAEGSATTASGKSAHAEGTATIANSNNQHVFGSLNIEDTPDATTNIGTYVEIVGNGYYDTTLHQNVKSNARTLDWSGNEWLAGTLTLGNTTLTEADIIALHTPAEGGEY